MYENEAISNFVLIWNAILHCYSVFIHVTML